MSDEINELELVPTEDLIAELTRRKTFLGVLVYSPTERKGKKWSGKFHVRFPSSITLEDSRKIINQGLDIVDKKIDS